VHLAFWQQQKQHLVSALREKVVGDREQAIYRELVQEDLPEFFQVYLRNQARKIFQEERPVRLRASSRYDFGDPDLKKDLMTLRERIIAGTVFSQEELTRVIETSIHIQFDVLVRPRQTMEEMLFRNHSERQRQDIIVIVQGFGEERPFVRELLVELRSREDDQITSEEFHRLATQVEDRIYTIKPISTFLQELTSYLQFEKKVTSIERNTVSGAMVVGMLKERRLNDLAASLESEAETKNEWPLNEIEAALEGVLLTRGLEMVEQKKETEEELLDEIVLESSAEEEQEPLSVDFKPNDLPEEFAPVNTVEEPEGDASQQPTIQEPHIDFAEEKTPTTSAPAAAPTSSDAAAASQMETQKPKPQSTILFSDDEEPLVIDRQTIEQQPPGPYPALHTLIDARSRKMIMKKIFRKNKEEYVAFVEKLERVESWKEAKALIDLELHRRGISPYSKEAVRLGDILFSRYFSRTHR